MGRKLVLALIVFFPLAAFAGDMFNAKEGLWEMTVTTSGGGMGIPADKLASMTPDQRAMMEQMMKQKGISMSGNAITVKSCVTKEKIAKGAAFSDNRSGSSDCTHSVVKSSASHMEVKFHCDSKNGGTTDGNSSIDIAGDSVKGTTHVTNTNNGNSKTFDSSFTSKYLGAECGDIK